MISNLEHQLETLGLGDRLTDILDEAGRVREDLGYPIVVSPFAQYIVTQATLNVVNGERYKVIPDEIRRYALGRCGAVPGRIEPDLFDRIARAAAAAMKERGGGRIITIASVSSEVVNPGYAAYARARRD